MESENAKEDLHYIRQIMSKVSPPLSMSGWMGVGWGIVFFIGGVVTYIFQVVTNGSLNSSFLLYLWIPLFVIGSVTEVFFYVRKCLSTGMPVFTKHISYLYLGFASSIFAGIALQMVLSKLGGHLYIPGLWMLILGSGSIIFGLLASLEICVMGVMFMVGGFLAVGPFVHISFLMLSLFGGIGTILWGLWVNRRLGG